MSDAHDTKRAIQTALAGVGAKPLARSAAALFLNLLPEMPLALAQVEGDLRGKPEADPVELVLPACLSRVKFPKLRNN
jgi:hypothetical protein